MGSLEEEKLVQMVHDFIESGSSPPIFPASSECLSLTNYYTLLEILRNRTDAETEVLENVIKHITRNKMDAEKTNSLKKWLVKRLKLDGYIASLCKTSWVTSSACPGGDYEYIDVLIKDENDVHTERLIVDIDFKSQFELARPTSTYKDLSDTLPNIFVGSEDKLIKIISLLCSAAKQSLRERGLHIPPWRTSTYMQSKWLSYDHCHKNPAAAIASSSREVGIENGEAKINGHGFSNWTPPMVKKPKRSNLGNGSGLSNQFSNMSINCC